MKFWLFCFGLLLILVGYVVTVYGVTSDEMLASANLILIVLCIFIKHLSDDDDRKGHCSSYTHQEEEENK
jgi:hypothetical protein